MFLLMLFTLLKVQHFCYASNILIIIVINNAMIKSSRRTLWDARVRVSHNWEEMGEGRNAHVCNDVYTPHTYVMHTHTHISNYPPHTHTHTHHVHMHMCACMHTHKHAHTHTHTHTHTHVMYI